jgi:molybdenum cofactor cytidylyltransferase
LRFGEVALANAAGGILAHGCRRGGLSFKKGHLLSADDVARLGAAGFATLWVARFDDGDVAEDTAAAGVAAPLAGSGVTAAPAATGRCNLFADRRGLLALDGERVGRLNGVDEGITVATLPPYAVVAAGQMVATVKIIPFAVPRSAIERCVAIVTEDSPPLRVLPFRPRPVALIQSRLPETKDSVLAGTVEATGRRVGALGGTLAPPAIVEHRVAAIADGIRRAVEGGCDPVLVLGASAIVDRQDVIPQAVVALGGEVVHFGMPVEPGNLLLLARLGRVTVLGLPGCARSPKLNGFDWVLERLFADVPVTARDIVRMGVGGLLIDAAVPSRAAP